MMISDQLEGLYFYSFTSGSSDSYSFDGMYVSTELISESAWDTHLRDWLAERDRITNAVPLVEVTTYMGNVRTIRDINTPEWLALREHLITSAEQTFILKHGLVAIEETEVFHRD